jgi:serine/threonine-protein kinase
MYRHDYHSMTADDDSRDAEATLDSGATLDGGDASGASVGSFTSAGQRFRIVRPHARGGLGAVYIAIDGELHREVALKQIVEERADDPSSRDRFVVEAEITGALEHPGVVPVYGMGKDPQGRPYYAMRFIHGDSLDDAIVRFHADESLQASPGRRSLELRKLLRRFLDVCNAIDYAHSRGVLHRDLKPGNVIVGKHGETLVVDWGLAKAQGRDDVPRSSSGPGESPILLSALSRSTETVAGSTIGTPAFMSPEQARGDLESLGPATDVYSLGATLYCLLTGKLPFSGSNLEAVLRDVEAGRFPPPRARDARIDKPLEAVCVKAMALEPESRYPGARALADDVERWIADEPVSAHRDSLTTRLARWGRHHRTATVSIAVLLGTAVVALSVGSLLINRERAAAEASFRQARAAVDQYFTSVSESKLFAVPGLQPLRKDLLSAAEKYYRDFLEKRGNDPSVRADAATASFRAGWINTTLGDDKTALELYRSGARLAEQLVAAHPESVEYRRLLATMYGAQGLSLGGLGRTEEALAAHRKALQIRQALLKESPDDALAAIDVARTHRNMGGLYNGEGKPAQALGEWDEAVRIARPLLEKPLGNARKTDDLSGRTDVSAIVREDLASVLLDQSSTLVETGRGSDARAVWTQARDLFEALSRDHPKEIALRRRLADAYADGARMEARLGNMEEALPLSRRATEIREGMVAANPAVSAYRSLLADDLVILGWIYRRLDRTPEALAAYQRAGEVAEELLAIEPENDNATTLLAQSLQLRASIVKERSPAEALPLVRRAVALVEPIVRRHPDQIHNVSTLASLQMSLGRAEAAAGNASGAFAAYERSVATNSPAADRYPDIRYNIACALALMVPVAPAARREAIASQAVETVRQAYAAGYADASALTTDKDLDALRSRADFKALVAEKAPQAAAKKP